MIALFVWLLIFGLVCWLVYYIIGLLPLPPLFKQIALAVLGVLALIALVERVYPLFGGSAGTGTL